MDKVKIKIIEKQEALANRQEDYFDIRENADKVFTFISNLPNLYEKSGYYQKLKLQSLIFKEKPTFNFSKNQTRKLSLILQTEKELVSSNSPKVHS